MPERLQGSPFLPPTRTGPSLHVEVTPYDTPAPIPDVDALVFLAGRPGELFSCMAGAFVDEFGQVKEVFTRGSPGLDAGSWARPSPPTRSRAKVSAAATRRAIGCRAMIA